MITRNLNPPRVKDVVRYKEVLVFMALVVFFLIGFPGNRSEADDGLTYAYLVKTKSWIELLQPRYLLFLPMSKLLYNLFPIDPYYLMCVVSSVFSSATLVICYRFLIKVLHLQVSTALWGCAFLLFSYGYWRYSVEAEVYSISNFFCIAIVYLLCVGKNKGTIVLAGLLAGLAVLVYKPSAIPVFFVFPFCCLIRKQWVSFFLYPAIGGIVVLTGYFLAFYYVSPASSFVQFLTDGATRSYGSVLVTIFVVISNIVSTNFLYGIDAVEQFIRAKFPANLIVEEVFAANNNGAWNYVAIVTAGLLAITMLILLVLTIRHFSKRFLRSEHFILLGWIILYGAVLMYLDPNSPEPWTMLIMPIVLTITAMLIAPVVENNSTRKWAWLVILLLLLHNVIGGYGVIATEKSDYIAQKSSWLKKHAQKGDLVLSLGSGSMLAYIIYYTPASICSPEQDFDGCMRMAEKTIAANHKVYIMEDMINRDSAIKFRDEIAFQKVTDFINKFKDHLTVVNPQDQQSGKIYELQYIGKLP